jgi:hypothetical protein
MTNKQRCDILTLEADRQKIQIMMAIGLFPPYNQEAAVALLYGSWWTKKEDAILLTLDLVTALGYKITK